MDFIDLDISSLKSTINSCLSGIDTSATTDFIDTISSTDYWDDAAKQKVLRALKKLKDEKYKDLKDQLTSCLGYLDELQLIKDDETKLKELEESGKTEEANTLREQIKMKVRNLEQKISNGR